MKNETLMQYFEWDMPADSMHWKRCAHQADKLAKVGITGVWLPPAYKGMNGKQDVGYGVYDTYDLGEFDQKGSIPTKYGSKKEYLAAVKALQKNGIKVYADIVLNHMMGADACESVMATEMAEHDRDRAITGMREISAWTKYDFKGRNGRYSSFCWNKSHFTGCDWDESQKRKSLYLFEGKAWNDQTDNEKSNYDYLMGTDLDMDNEEVKKALLDWGLWYAKTVGMDGFRLDAVKHIESTFYREWIREIREQTGKAFSCIGEYWKGDLKALLSYLDSVENEISLFDVPLHFNFYHASKSGGNYNMRTLTDNSLLRHRPEKAITFVDNHDTQPGQALESFVDAWFKPLAYAVVLLQEKGVPCVFYGDYYGIRSRNIAPVSGLHVLIKIRELYAYGPQVDYFDHENVVGFIRKGVSEQKHSGIAVLMSDGPGGNKYMCMGKENANKTYYDASGRCFETVTTDENGWGNFRCDGGSVSVWITENAYEYIRTELE